MSGDMYVSPANVASILPYAAHNTRRVELKLQHHIPHNDYAMDCMKAQQTECDGFPSGVQVSTQFLQEIMVPVLHDVRGGSDCDINTRVGKNGKVNCILFADGSHVCISHSRSD